MRLIGAQLPIGLVLVGVPVAAAVVATTQHQTPLPVTAAVRRHYFEVGYRQCEHAIKQIQAPAQSQRGQQLLSYQVGLGFRVDAGGGLPREFRRAAIAGCRAAAA